MLVACPKCKAKYRIDDNRIGPDGIKLRCTKCQVIFRMIRRPQVPESPSPVVSPPTEKTVPAVPPPGDVKFRVLIGHESQGFCSAVRGVLAGEPFDVTETHDGDSALAKIRETLPHVVLLDVALPGMFGFQVCEVVKNDPALSQVKVILIAAIYDKTRYKRMPSSLYAADDYIEKHHIPDDLVAKIYRLVSGQTPVSGKTAEKTDDGKIEVTSQAEAETESLEAARAEIRNEEAATTETAPAAPLSEAHLKAKRLARIIVSDIALYNQGKLHEGVRNGTFFDLVENDIKEGRSLYMQRVSAEIRATTDYLEEAFRDMVSKVSKELNL
jgi:predicted Zn finger-like uncharacterized protein